MGRDVQHDLILGEPETRRRRPHDPLVRLVRHHEVDVVGGEARPVERPTHRVDHAAHRDLEDRLALEVEPGVLGIAERRQLAAGSEGGHHHRRPGHTVSAEIGAEHAGRTGTGDVGIITRLVDRGAGTVAEEHAGVAIPVVDQEVEFLDADDQHRPLGAGRDHRGRRHPQNWITSEFFDYLKQMKIMGLSGLEVYYPGYNSSVKAQLIEICESLDLLISGGSDFHGENKPSNLLGIGYENNPIKVPLNLLSRMEEAYAKL